MPKPIEEHVFRLKSAIDPATVLATVFFPALLAVEYEAGLVFIFEAIPAGLVCVLSMMMRLEVGFQDIFSSELASVRTCVANCLYSEKNKSVSTGNSPFTGQYLFL